MENTQNLMKENLTKANLCSKELDYDDKSKNVSKQILERCPKCGEPTGISIYMAFMKRNVKVHAMCKCEKEALEAEKRKEEALEKQIRLQQIFKNSLMDHKFINDKFENWDTKKGNKKMYTVAKVYAENFDKFKKEGFGMIFYGKPGNGKTFTASCIANYLMPKMVSVICVNINNLLNRIKQTYNSYGTEAEEDIIRSLNHADLLIIDDLGTEQNTDWTKTKIYSIIDSRYRSKLPLIITTNYDNKQFVDKYDERTVDRILEMCTPVFNDGKSIRCEKAKGNTNILKNYIRESSCFAEIKDIHENVKDIKENINTIKIKK